MARIKLKLPEKFIFSTFINVRITDINYGGHLGNDSVLSLIHEARVRFLADKGFTESNIDGIGIMMTDAVIQYSSQGFYGDKIRIDVTVGEFSDTNCDLFYRFVNTENEKIIVKAKTNIVFYNYENNRVSKIPQLFIKEYFKY